MAISAVAGLVSAIGAAAAGLKIFGLAATTLGGFAAAFAVGAGLSMVSRALAPKPNLGAQMRGIQQTTREPASSRKIIYGRMRVGGQVVFISHSGDDNKYMHMAIAFASHEIQAYDEIWFNDNKIWTASGGFQGDWGTYVTIDRKFGTAGQSASTQLVNANSLWTTDHKLSGIAYIAFRLEWDQDKFPQGVPNITATIRGKKVYDPRTQTTAYSQNPALCVRDYMISEYGLDEVAANINDTSVSDAADLCDESVSLDGGGTQDRYQCNGVIDTANQIKANIEQLLASMGGKLTYSGGEYFIDGAEYKTPSHTFTEADVISDIQTQTKQSRRGGYNGVKGIFVSEEKNYKVLDYPAQISSTYEAEDGDPVYLDMPLPCVTNNTQAQRLAKIALLKSRQQVVMTLTVNLKGLNVKVGDTIQVTNDRLNYSSKVFEVIDYSLAIGDGEALGVNLVCIETASAIYDWTTSDEADFLSGGELPLYDGRTVDNVTSLTMTEIGLRGPDGGVKSAVELSWTAPTDAFIEFYTVRYNKTGTTNYFEVQTRETNALLEGLDISSNYDFRVKAQNLIGVRSSGTSLTNQALNGDTTAPSAPTSGAATGGIQTITAEWSNPTDIDFKHVEVFVNTTNSIPATPTAVVDGEEYIVTGLSGKETRYFWLKSVDFSGNKSAATASFSATAVKALSGDIDNDAVGNAQIADNAVDTDQINDGAVDTDQIADDAVDITKIANTLQSTNYVAATSGWKLTTDGTFEAGDGTFRGNITATSITLEGTSITNSQLATGVQDSLGLADSALQDGDTSVNLGLDDGSIAGISINSTKLYAGTGTWANSNTGFYLDNTGKFSLKDKFFYNPTNNLLTVDGNITADVITAKENLVVLGDLEASSMAAGSITRAMFSQDALDEIYGALATSVGGSNGDYKEASGNFTTSGGTVTVGTSSDKFDHGTADVDVEFLANTYFYTTTDYSLAQAQATLNFEVSADGTFTDLTSATKTQTLQFGRYDLTSYYGYTYLVYYFNGEHTKTFTTGTGNDIPDSTELQFRVRVTGVGTAFTSQTIPFTVEANEGVTGVVSTGGNADTLDNLDSTKFLRSDVDSTISANLTVGGNLTVNGTQTTLNTATLQVEDKNIVLNYGTGDTSGSANGAGITIQDAVNSSTDATILWNATTDKFDFSHGIDVTGATTLDGYVYVNVAGNNLVLQSDSLQRETIQWTQNNVNRWKLNLQADGDLDFVPADTADKLLYNNNEIATQSWVSSQNYLTSFSETDTLATVTGRGASTSNDITLSGNLILDPAGDNNLRFVATNDAYQRADARVDATTHARVHWYGKRSDGATVNYRHAWYTGSTYVNVTAESGGVKFGGRGAFNTSIDTSKDLVVGEHLEIESGHLYLDGTVRINENGNATLGSITSGAINSTGTSLFNNFRLTDASRMGFGTVKSGDTVGHTASGDEGIFWHTDSSYGIYRTAGSWASPNYQQLKLDWPTGIIIDGGSAYGKSGVRIDSQLNVATASYEGSIVFGTQSSWHCGIRQHDDADAEMRIWHKNANGMIFLATGYDGEPASISRPTDGLVVQSNNVGIGNFSSVDPQAKLHVKSTSDSQLRLDGDGTSWAGIQFADNGGSDYLWYFGATDTWSFGGGGSSGNSNKRIHSHGGMTIGSSLTNSAPPNEGLLVQGEIQQNTNKIVRDSKNRYVGGGGSYYGSGSAGWYKVAQVTITGNCQASSLYGHLEDRAYHDAQHFDIAVVIRAECSFTSNNEDHFVEVACTLTSGSRETNYRNKIRVVLVGSSTNSRTYELQFYETSWNEDYWELWSSGWTLYDTPQATGTATGTARVNYQSKINADRLYANDAMHSPVFYDSTDTGYYIRPNTGGASINVRGNAYIGRHLDAVNAWDGTGNSRKALFLGWYGDKVILGNNDDSVQDTAYNYPDDAVICGNPLYGHMDIKSRTALKVGSSEQRWQVYGTHSMSGHSVSSISFDWNANYDDATYHGIMSTNASGAYNDNLSINSYNDLTIRLDSNNNNSSSYLRVYNNTNTNGGGPIFWTGFNGSVNQTKVNGYLGINTEPRTDGYMLALGGPVHAGNNEINYVAQVHFQDNVRFYDSGNDSYLNFKYGDASTGGIRFRNGSGNQKGFLYADSSGFGLLDSDGQWAVQTRTGTNSLRLYCNNTVGLDVGTNYVSTPHKFVLGTFPASTSNAGEAWIGRASDRAAGIMTVQLGTGSGRRFEVVDSGWTTVEFEAGDNGVAIANQSFRSLWFYNRSNASYGIGMGQGTTANRNTTPHGYIDFGPMNSGGAHIYTDRARFYFNKIISCISGSITSYNGDFILYRNEDSAHKFTLSTTGVTASGNVTAFSDGRLKTDVQPITGALSTVRNLRGVTYTRKDIGTKDIGFIAQEIEESCPEIADRIVNTSDDEMGTKHLNYQNMVALLTEAIKEQQSQIEALQSQVKSLEEKLK